jgi:hypothetical protein
MLVALLMMPLVTLRWMIRLLSGLGKIRRLFAVIFVLKFASNINAYVVFALLCEAAAVCMARE